MHSTHGMDRMSPTRPAMGAYERELQIDIERARAWEDFEGRCTSGETPHVHLVTRAPPLEIERGIRKLPDRIAGLFRKTPAAGPS